MYDYYPHYGYRPVLSAPPTSLRVDMNKNGTLLGMVDDEVGQGHDQLEHGREQFRQRVEMLPLGYPAPGRRSLTEYSAGCPRVIDAQLLLDVANTTSRFLDGSLRDGPSSMVAPCGSSLPMGSSPCSSGPGLDAW